MNTLSSFSSSSCSDPRPVDVSHGIFHSIPKTLLLSVFQNIAIYPSSGSSPGILPLVVVAVTGGVTLASAAD